MAIVRKAKITVDLDRLGWSKTKYFTGTEEQIYMEAIDWMNAFALEFIAANDIEDEWEQDLIIAGASNIIEWENEPMKMYAVNEEGIDNPVYGVYLTLADAEEAIFTECEDWVYEVMMTEDPEDVCGDKEWRWNWAYNYLMRDCASAFSIQEIPVYGVCEVCE